MFPIYTLCYFFGGKTTHHRCLITLVIQKWNCCITNYYYNNKPIIIYYYYFHAWLHWFDCSFSLPVVDLYNYIGSLRLQYQYILQWRWLLWCFWVLIRRNSISYWKESLQEDIMEYGWGTTAGVAIVFQLHQTKT